MILKKPQTFFSLRTHWDSLLLLSAATIYCNSKNSPWKTSQESEKAAVPWHLWLKRMWCFTERCTWEGEKNQSPYGFSLFLLQKNLSKAITCQTVKKVFLIENKKAQVRAEVFQTSSWKSRDHGVWITCCESLFCSHLIASRPETIISSKHCCR